ncbi:hypothetical protein ACFY2R_13060 [Micromonospora olivasterospora]|uniref:Uncharacterized protein n=1 Tax=Micromonospora olivasterospora TaxID=1880 RepID=A0A562IB70_MICOL|nr:hypothetical protein [Micromonospora olivasterospora]TWH67943.1 hypothetical protein JD77_02929 [Micromonospora olivasterospora]
MTAPISAATSAATFALAEARAASLTLVGGLRLSLVLAVAVADVPAMWRAGATWSTEVGTELAEIQAKLDDAMDKAKEGWTADDFDALEKKLKEIGKELANVQSSAGLVGGGMFAVAGAYTLFWAYAAVVATLTLALAIMVLAAQFTPAGPALRGVAESIVNGLVTVLDLWVTKLAAVGAAFGAFAGAAVVGALSGPALLNIDDRTAKLEQVKIEWAPPNKFISPQKTDPVTYEEANK